MLAARLQPSCVTVPEFMFLFGLTGKDCADCVGEDGHCSFSKPRSNTQGHVLLQHSMKGRKPGRKRTDPLPAMLKSMQARTS